MCYFQKYQQQHLTDKHIYPENIASLVLQQPRLIHYYWEPPKEIVQFTIKDFF